MRGRKRPHVTQMLASLLSFPSAVFLSTKRVSFIHHIFLFTLSLCISGAEPAGEGSVGAGGSERAHVEAGEQLPGSGALAQPVRPQTAGQLTSDV